MVSIIISAVITSFLLVISGVALKVKEYAGGLTLLVMGLMFIFVMGTNVYYKIPNGMPKSLMADGIYQVRIVHLRIPEGPGISDSVGVLVLREEGKTDKKIPIYCKVPLDFFKAGDQKDLHIGQEMTIKLKLFTSFLYRKIEVVK